MNYKCSFRSIHELVSMAEENHQNISDITLKIQAVQMKMPEEDVFEKMKQNLFVMRESSKKDSSLSASGLCGSWSNQYAGARHRSVFLSHLTSSAVQKALAISEQNACMGKIVAAPTAGSCGILPAVLLAMGEEFGFDDDKLTMALLNASGMCMVIAQNACVSGAEGGCQAECGTASAIAASAAVELMGGTPMMSAHALAIAFKFIMGLVCDPVAGLVEVPCVKRNASGAVNALLAAELSLCGIESVIPADQVVEAMYQVGKSMNYTLKETALGGIAATDAAKKIADRLRRES